MLKKSTWEILGLEEIPMENLKVIEYPFEFSISKAQYNHILKKMGIVSDILDVRVDKKKVEFSQSGQIGTRKMVFKKDKIDKIQFKGKEIIKKQLEEEEQKKSSSTIIKRLTESLKGSYSFGTYSLTFLRLFGKVANILEKKECINFYLKTDHPLKAKIKIKLHDYTKKEILGEFKLVNYLANRPEEVNFDDDDDMDEF